MKEDRFGDFVTAITGIYRGVQKLKRANTMQLGLKNVHVFWLYLLAVNPEGLSASQLAEAGRTTRALVSREIEYLIEKGYITANGATGHRRYGWKFVLTEQGSEVAERIKYIARSVQDHVSRDIPEEDLIVFYRTLNLLLTGFDELTERE